MKLIISSCQAYESIWNITSEEGIEILYSYISCHSLLLFQMQKIFNRFISPPRKREIWYNKDLRNIEDTCVVFDANTTEDFLDWFAHNNPKARLIFYYWNVYEKERNVHPDAVRSKGYEVWSFDPQDCQRYQMKLNDEFYCRSWYKSLERNVEPKYDISFIGRDKNGRMSQVLNLKERYEEFDIKWLLYFTANCWYRRYCNKNYRKYLTYTQVLQKQLEAVAVLDYAHEKQSSITLRTFDALCNGRKVITNNKEIVNEKIYNKQDFFVIGIDDDSSLRKFLSSPFEPIEDDLLEERSIVGWKRRFGA